MATNIQDRTDSAERIDYHEHIVFSERAGAATLAPRERSVGTRHLALRTRIALPDSIAAPRQSVAPAALPLPTAAPVRVERGDVALAGLYLLLGYEWLVSGVDKLLIGNFPDQLGNLLRGSLSGNHLPGFFAAILRTLVAPNAVLFGGVIEFAELLAGIALITAGLVTLLNPLATRHLTGTLARLYRGGTRLLSALTPLAAIGTALLGLSFFLLNGLPAPWFTPSIAYGGAIDTGLFLAVGSLILLAAQWIGQRARR